MTKNERGFTIVELMIAATVFSVMLMLVAGSVVRFTSNFQKGLVETSTQNAARSVLDTVSQDLQFSGSHFGVITPGQSYCLGSTKYEATLGQQLEDQTPHVLVQTRGTGSGCTGVGSTSQEMLSPHMRLTKFTIVESGNLYTVTVKVAYGDNDLLDNPSSSDPVCRAVKGSQFCAVRELSTTVQRRL